jgi:hypothetical protein
MLTPEVVGVPIRGLVDHPGKADVLPQQNVMVDLFSPLPLLEGIPEEPIPLNMQVSSSESCSGRWATLPTSTWARPLMPEGRTRPSNRSL